MANEPMSTPTEPTPVVQPVEGSQGAEQQPKAGAVDTAEIQRLVNEGIERGLSEYQAQYAAQMESKLTSLAQSLSDKRFNRMMKKVGPQLEALDSLATRLQWTPEQLATYKSETLAKGYQEESNAPPDTAPAPSQQQQEIPPDKVWTRPELEQWVSQTFGLTPDEFDVSKWAGYRHDDPRGKGIYNAAKSASEAKVSRLQAQSAARQLKQTQEQFGGSGALPSGDGGAAPMTEDALIADINRVNKLLSKTPVGVERTRLLNERSQLMVKYQKYEANIK